MCENGPKSIEWIVPGKNVDPKNITLEEVMGNHDVYGKITEFDADKHTAKESMPVVEWKKE